MYVPLNLWLNALVGGPVLALVGLRAARWEPACGRFGRAALALSTAAFAANLVSFGLQSASLPFIENAFLAASDLVPYYGLMIAAFGVLALAGIGLDAQALLGRTQGGGRQLGVARAAAACALVLAGIFVMRFAFYMMHLTVGLGV